MHKKSSCDTPRKIQSVAPSYYSVQRLRGFSSTPFLFVVRSQTASSVTTSTLDRDRTSTAERLRKLAGDNVPGNAK